MDATHTDHAPVEQKDVEQRDIAKREMAAEANISFLQKKQSSSPEDFARYTRSFGDIYWWPLGKFWVISDHALANQVMRSADFTADRSSFFISRMPDLDPSLIMDFFAVVKRMMVMSDQKVHTRRRRTAACGFGEDLLQSYQSFIDDIVQRLIRNVQSQESFDFVTDFATQLPSIVLADLFDIDEKDRELFYSCSNDMTQFFGGASAYQNEDGVKVNKSTCALRAFFHQLMEQRRSQPKGDFLSVLVENQNRFNLDDEEVVSQAIMMLVAGQITTTDQMCNNLFTILKEPARLQVLQEDFDLMDTALEECNRLDPAVTFLFRVTKKTTVVGDAVLSPGDVVFISNHGVNRDPKVFTEPDSFILQRPQNPHFAYGQGAHYCLGSKLAKMQMTTLFTELMQAFPKMKLSPHQHDVVRKHESLAFSGFDKLIVRKS